MFCDDRGDDRIDSSSLDVFWFSNAATRLRTDVGEDSGVWYIVEIRFRSLKSIVVVVVDDESFS